MSPRRKTTFEVARDELETDRASTEDGNVTLQESLDLWQRGEELAAHATGCWGQAESRIEAAKKRRWTNLIALTNGQNSWQHPAATKRWIDAVVTVKKALDLYGPPIYVRKQIVHNVHVVADLERRGAIFVDETDEVPEGSRLVFSAHGVSPSVHDQAQRRNLKPRRHLPLVTKVHR